MRENIVVICPTPQARMRATDWHDGQFVHVVYAGMACGRRVDRAANSSRLSLGRDKPTPALSP